MVRLFARGLLCLTLLFVNLSCSVNVLETFADKNTNEAYFIDAKKLINSGSYTEALAKINLMSGDYRALRKVLLLEADAYGGLCGINFLSFVEALGGMTGNLMTFLMQTYGTGTLAMADACEDAEDILESIGDATARTSDENVRMMVIGFTKIGNILGHYADTNDDDTADPTFDSCAAGDIPDTYIRQVGTGVTLALESLTALSGSVNLGGGALTSISSVCGLLVAPYDFCAVTDPTAFDADEIKGIRTLLKEDDVIGLGADCTGPVGSCNCP